MANDLELKLENLTNRFNSLIERLNKAGLKGTLDFSDLEMFEEYSGDEEFTEEENHSEDFDLMPK